MISLVNCPHCHTRVLPMAERRCPACGRNVDSTSAEPTPEPLARALHAAATQQMLAGVALSEIQARLSRQGLDAKAAANVVRNLEQVKARATQHAGQNNMLIGALCCILGIALTAYTYLTAAAHGGGKFVIAWGAIIFGGIQFVRGLNQSVGE